MGVRCWVMGDSGYLKSFEVSTNTQHPTPITYLRLHRHLLCALLSALHISGIVDHLALRLLLDVVVGDAVHVLAGHHLRVTESVADGEGHARDGHLDVSVAGEVLTAVLAFYS